MIAIDLSRQETLDAKSKGIHKINFTGYLDQDADTTMFFILEESEKAILDS